MASGSATPRCPRSCSILDERGRRLLVAAEAKAAGYGGIAAVWRATGVTTSTIGRGLRELAEAPALTAGRVRRAGGGRKPAVAADPDLMRDLKALVEPTARGDPEGPLRWTCKSLRRLADELQAQGHQISRTLVGELLHGLGFSLQAKSRSWGGRCRTAFMIWPPMPAGSGWARTMTRQPLRGRPSGAGGRRSGDRVILGPRA